MHLTASAAVPAASGLAQLVELLLMADARSPTSDVTTLLRIEATASGDDFPAAFELGFTDLDADFGEHPGDVLLGYTAPADWWGIGVVASGRTHVLADGQAGPVPNTARTARLAHLVGRNGHSALAYRHRDAAQVEVVHCTSAVSGYLADVCRRSLGLATAPPELGAEHHWEDRWLEWLMADAIGLHGRLTWARAVALHPLADELPLDAAPPLIQSLVGTRAAAGWEAIRATAASGGGAVLADGTCCSPSLAAWFDAASFSRALTGGLPDRAEMLATLAELVPPRVFASIRGALLPDPSIVHA